MKNLDSWEESVGDFLYGCNLTFEVEDCLLHHIFWCMNSYRHRQVHHYQLNHHASQGF